MARIPSAPDDIPAHADLVAAIRRRRGGRLLNLDRMLLHSPPLAQGWNAHLGAVREQLTLPPKLRELAICGVAVLNHASYEFDHHAPLYVAAGGTERAARALRDFERSIGDARTYGPDERAVMQLTLEMTRQVQVTDDTLSNVKQQLGDTRQVVELVGVIATYNMVSRFLVALGVDAEPDAAHRPSEAGT